MQVIDILPERAHLLKIMSNCLLLVCWRDVLRRSTDSHLKRIHEISLLLYPPESIFLKPLLPKI